MTTQIQAKVPVNSIISPTYPNPQTACGILDDGVIYDNKAIQLAGQSPNTVFWSMRNEYCNQLEWSNQSTIGTVLARFDVLRYCGNDMNDPEVFLNRTAWDVQLPFGRVMWPRWYSLNASTYVTLGIKYDFWIHKPVGPVVAGKLRLSYSPGFRKNFLQSKLDGGDFESGIEDTLFRENMWEWDIKASDTFSVTLRGNIPLKFIHSSLPNSTLATDPRVFFPFFQSTFGTLTISVLNTYAPGSIFADTANISVYKSFDSPQFFVMRGHRNDQKQMVI